MLFNSLQFLIFLPVVLLLYYALPQKVRYLWLLAASYYFYMCWNASYALLIFFSTVVTWGMRPHSGTCQTDWWSSSGEEQENLSGSQLCAELWCFILL